MRNYFSRSAPLVVGKGGVMVAGPMPPLISLELPANSNQSLHHRPHTPFADTAGKCWFRLLHFFCLHLSGQYPPPPPTAKWVLENTGEALTTQHAQKAYMSPVGKATSLWKLSNWWQTIMHPVYEYFGCYAPCIIWIVWISCTLYINTLDIMHPV